MAKKESKVIQQATPPAKTSKAKKRKHVHNENDEEVASKSLIVEAKPNVNVNKTPAQETEPAKSLKRKIKEKSKIKEKRAKHTSGADGATQDADAEADAPPYEPTLDELRESEKPENVVAIVTVRQKKKQKHQQRMEVLKDQTVDKERLRNEEYLRKWKQARVEWKFEKLRQISIQQTVFDEEKIKSDFWPLALEYLSGSKGAAKAQIIKLAEQCIDELDKQCAQEMCDDEARQVIIDSIKYQRARDLLQSFD